MAPDRDQSGEPRGHPATARSPSAELDDVRARSARALLLPAEASAAGRARAELRAFLAQDDVSAERLFELQLLVTELVSNAVRHGSRAGDEVELAFDRPGGDLRVSVADAGRGESKPAVRAQSSTARSGRGLRAVERLSDEWAAERRAGRCAVWFRARLQVRPALG